MIGRSASFLHSEETDRKAAAAFSEKLRTTGTATVTLINQSKDGVMFTHRLEGTRIVEDGVELLAAQSTCVKVHSRRSARKQWGAIGILVALTAICAVTMLGRISEAEPGGLGTRDTAVPPHPPASWHWPARKTVDSPVPLEQANAANNLKAAAGGMVRRVAQPVGFFSLAALMNLDLLLFTPGAAVTSHLLLLTSSAALANEPRWLARKTVESPAPLEQPKKANGFKAAVGRVVQRVARPAGFFSLATLANLDLLLFTSGAAVASGL